MGVFGRFHAPSQWFGRHLTRGTITSAAWNTDELARQHCRLCHLSPQRGHCSGPEGSAALRSSTINTVLGPLCYCCSIAETLGSAMASMRTKLLVVGQVVCLVLIFTSLYFGRDKLTRLRLPSLPPTSAHSESIQPGKNETAKRMPITSFLLGQWLTG